MTGLFWFADSARAVRMGAALVALLVAGLFVSASPARAVDGTVSVTFSGLDESEAPFTRICVSLLAVSDLEEVTWGGAWSVPCESLSPGTAVMSTSAPPGSYYLYYQVGGATAAYYPGVEDTWSALPIVVTGGATTNVDIDEDAFFAGAEPRPTGLVDLSFQAPEIEDVSWAVRFTNTLYTNAFLSDYLPIDVWFDGDGDSIVRLPEGNYIVELIGDGDSYWSFLGNTSDYEATPVVTVQDGETTLLDADASDYEFGELTIEYPEAEYGAYSELFPENLPNRRQVPQASIGLSDPSAAPKLAPGNYVVRYDIRSPGVPRSFYAGGATTMESASTVSVVANATVEAQYTEPQSGTLSFTGVAENPLGSYGVTPYAEWTPTYGIWSSGELLAYGDYGLYFEYPGGMRSVDAPFPWDSAPIVVDSPGETFDLAQLEFAELSGTVSRTGSAEIEQSAVPRQAIVFGYSDEDDAYYEAASIHTDADGDFEFDWLAPGTYKVGFREYASVNATNIAWATGWGEYASAPIDTFYGGDSLETATEIVLSADEVQTGVNGVISYDATPPEPPTLSDIAGNQFEADILWMVEQGITTGYDDGTFRPTANVSRQAMAAFMYRLAGEPDVTLPPSSPFGDVATTSQFYEAIVWMAQEGISTGYDDDTFRPSANVSRQAMAAFMYRLAGEPDLTLPPTTPFHDVATTSQFYVPIVWMAQEEISTGYDDDTFRPSANVTRQAMAAFMHRLAPLLEP